MFVTDTKLATCIALLDIDYKDATAEHVKNNVKG